MTTPLTSTTNSTTNESKVSAIIMKILQKEIEDKQELLEDVSNVELNVFELDKNQQNVLLVSLPIKILGLVRMNYNTFLKSIKNLFPNKIVLTIRSGDISPAKKSLNLVASRELIVKDLCFPAHIMGRSQDIVSFDDVTQYVFLNGQQQYWNSLEVTIIEGMLFKILNERFIIKPFISNL